MPTTPDFPNLARGVFFNLYLGNGAAPEVFSALCIATTLKFDKKIVTETAMVQDCANPTNLAVRKSVPTGVTFDLEFSGKVDFAKFAPLEALADGGDHNFQVVRAGTGANGGGVWQGAAKLVDVSLQKSENGLVTFTAKLDCQGLWLFQAAA